MRASATALKLTKMFNFKSCHTRSDAGFCNLMISDFETMEEVVIPAQMRASATHNCSFESHKKVLSYPLRCGLLQPPKRGIKNYKTKVVIPAQMRASATAGAKGVCPSFKLSYPLRCGLLQQDEPPKRGSENCCHTRSDAGFCNKKRL